MSFTHLHIDPPMLPRITGSGGYHTLTAIKDDVEQTVNNSVNYVRDLTLAVPTVPNFAWVAQYHLVFFSTNVANIKFRLVTPNAEGSGYFGGLRIDAAGNIVNTVFNTDTDGINCRGNGVANAVTVLLHATMPNFGDAVGFTYLEFAQNTAEVSDTILSIGSWVVAFQTSTVF